MNWCGPQGGLDFYLDSQAREFPELYMRALRAQWIGDALGEDDVDLRQYGKGGGLWNGLAFYCKRVIVEDAKSQQATVEEELASREWPDPTIAAKRPEGRAADGA